MPKKKKNRAKNKAAPEVLRDASGDASVSARVLRDASEGSSESPAERRMTPPLSPPQRTAPLVPTEERIRDQKESSDAQQYGLQSDDVDAPVRLSPQVATPEATTLPHYPRKRTREQSTPETGPPLLPSLSWGGGCSEEEEGRGGSEEGEDCVRAGGPSVVVRSFSHKEGRMHCAERDGPVFLPSIVGAEDHDPPVGALIETNSPLAGPARTNGFGSRTTSCLSRAPEEGSIQVADHGNTTRSDGSSGKRSSAPHYTILDGLDSRSSPAPLTPAGELPRQTLSAPSSPLDRSSPGDSPFTTSSPGFDFNAATASPHLSEPATTPRSPTTHLHNAGAQEQEHNDAGEAQQHIVASRRAREQLAQTFDVGLTSEYSLSRMRELRSLDTQWMAEEGGELSWESSSGARRAEEARASWGLFWFEEGEEHSSSRGGEESGEREDGGRAGATAPVDSSSAGSSATAGGNSLQSATVCSVGNKSGGQKNQENLPSILQYSEVTRAIFRDYSTLLTPRKLAPGFMARSPATAARGTVGTTTSKAEAPQKTSCLQGTVRCLPMFLWLSLLLLVGVFCAVLHTTNYETLAAVTLVFLAGWELFRSVAALWARVYYLDQGGLDWDGRWRNFLRQRELTRSGRFLKRVPHFLERVGILWGSVLADCEGRRREVLCGDCVEFLNRYLLARTTVDPIRREICLRSDGLHRRANIRSDTNT